MVMRKEIICLNEEIEKDWQDIAQQWCDIGREQGRHIYVLHNGVIHIVCEEIENTTCGYCGGVKYHPKEPFTHTEELAHKRNLLALEKAGEHICGCKELAEVD